tara:strand:+ start:158 stop:355 length:198 start_codon:yes stop_codon:yes gene_type:complete
MLRRLKAKILGQKPLSDEDIMVAYMDAAKYIKPAPLFAQDFARLIEAKHGIGAPHNVKAPDDVER